MHIVLQRFYHQQNQLREKELERQYQTQQQQHSFQQNSAEITTNPFLSSYIPPVAHQYHQVSHIPIASIAVAAAAGGASSTYSHSTSSQSSSTQSSSSQIAGYDYHHNHFQKQHHHQQQHRPLSPQLTTSTPFGSGFSDSGGGSSAMRSLQYQPLPQQFMPVNSLRQTTTATLSRSPPTSPEQHSDSVAIGRKSKLLSSSKRQLQTTAASSLSGSSSGIGSGSGIHFSSRENTFKEADHGKWLKILYLLIYHEKVYVSIVSCFNFQYPM